MATRVHRARAAMSVFLAADGFDQQNNNAMRNARHTVKVKRMKTRLVCIPLLCALTVSVSDAETIHLYDRGFGKSIYDKFAPEFKKATGFDLEFHLLEEPVYQNAELAMIHGELIDMVAMYPGTVGRLAEAGWLEKLDAGEEIDVRMDLMYKSAINSIVHSGEVFGASQLTIGLVVPLVDMEQLTAHGLRRDDFPDTWQALNQQMIDLADAGHKGIYWPFWYRGGIGMPLAFMAEVTNRGGALIDPESFGASMSANEGPAFETLMDWRRLLKSGAVDKDVLEMSYFESFAAMAQNKHLYSAYTVDGLLRAKDGGRKMTVLPRVEQSWGVMGSVVYGVVANVSDSDERKRAKLTLLKLYTQGLAGAEYAIAQELLETIGYFSAYQEFIESDRGLEIIRSRMSFPEDVPALMDLYSNMQYPEGEWSALWNHELGNFLETTLRQYLLDDSISPSDVILGFNAKLESLRREYGY